VRLCSYVVTNDTGFAPNPFWGHCTLAACTPNHMGVRLEPGDWIFGNQTVARGNGLVYAMEVVETLGFDRYYRDPRFKKKKPILNRTWQEACGDNIYFRDAQGVWKQHRSVFHTSPEEIRKDLRHHDVFVAEKFYYFGAEAIEIPSPFRELIQQRQGCSCKHDQRTVRGFLEWLRDNFEPGIHGLPADGRESNRCCAPAPHGSCKEAADPAC
jgi:hypothetical protein